MTEFQQRRREEQFFRENRIFIAANVPAVPIGPLPPLEFISVANPERNQRLASATTITPQVIEDAREALLSIDRNIPFLCQTASALKRSLETINEHFPFLEYRDRRLMPFSSDSYDMNKLEPLSAVLESMDDVVDAAELRSALSPYFAYLLLTMYFGVVGNALSMCRRYASRIQAHDIRAALPATFDSVNALFDASVFREYLSSFSTTHSTNLIRRPKSLGGEILKDFARELLPEYEETLERLDLLEASIWQDTKFVSATFDRFLFSHYDNRLGQTIVRELRPPGNITSSLFGRQLGRR